MKSELLDENFVKPSKEYITETCGGFRVDFRSEHQFEWSKNGYKIDANFPLTYKVPVDSYGNYQVKIKLQKTEPTPTLIFTGCRRLSHCCDTVCLHEITVAFHVQDVLAFDDFRRLENRCIEVSFLGEGNLQNISITKVNIPTLFIAGDSTVCDQITVAPYSSIFSYCGWGQMLPSFFDENIAICNLARGGLTVESFEKHGFQTLLFEHLCEGGFVLIQFGHNDQKLPELRAQDGYRRRISALVESVLQRKAVPILVSSLARNSWRNVDEYNDLLEEYAAVCEQVSADFDVPFIDLHKVSVDFIVKNGLRKSRKYFFPGDHTHTNDYGGYKVAEMVVDLLRHSTTSRLSNLIEHIRPHGVPLNIPLGLFFEKESDWLSPPLFTRENANDDAEDGICSIRKGLEIFRDAFNYFATNTAEFAEYDQESKATFDNGYNAACFEKIDLTLPISSEILNELLRFASVSRGGKRCTNPQLVSKSYSIFEVSKIMFDAKLEIFDALEAEIDSVEVAGM